MEFTEGMVLKVDALQPNGAVMGWIDGNYLSVSVHETNFISWFEENYADRYVLEPVIFDDLYGQTRARYSLGTEEGDSAFWAELHIWLHQNYDSVSLVVGENSLVFYWIPKEDAPINFTIEAREIGRKYITLRNKYGSRENYAACEIRDPSSEQVLGASSIFIPRY